MYILHISVSNLYKVNKTLKLPEHVSWTYLIEPKSLKHVKQRFNQTLLLINSNSSCHLFFQDTTYPPYRSTCKNSNNSKKIGINTYACWNFIIRPTNEIRKLNEVVVPSSNLKHTLKTARKNKIAIQSKLIQYATATDIFYYFYQTVSQLACYSIYLTIKSNTQVTVIWNNYIYTYTHQICAINSS